jgi:probable HAF family extracellular repeat protein
MNFQPNAPRRRTSRRGKRQLFVALAGLTVVVVGSAAAAQASGHGDGFLGPGPIATTPVSIGTTTAAAPTTSTSTAPTTTSTTSPTMTTAPIQTTSNWLLSVAGLPRTAFLTLGDQTDPTFNQLLGINDSGTIVGYFGSGADAAHPNKGYAINSPYSPISFADKNFPGSVQTQVIGVNKAGVKVGFYVDAAGATHGFVRRGTSWRSVNFPGTTSKPMVNQLLGINAKGIAAGFWNDAKDQAHGYLFNTRTGRFSSLRVPVSASAVTAASVNDQNEVVGFFTAGKNTKAFIWRGHSFRSVSLGNGTNTQALGVNDEGAVVGSFVDLQGHTQGFLWSGGRAQAVEVPAATSTVVNGLNDKGEMVGFYTGAGDRTLGFLAVH